MSISGSGLAAYGAGVGPCGHDPEDELEGANQQTPVAALEFDPYDRVYRQNEDYSMTEGAGPIHRAAHLILPLGSIPAVPASGLDIQAIRRAAPEARLAVIDDALRRAWKVLLETNQIAIARITILEEGPPWSGKFEVEVRDLVTKQSTTLEGRA